MEYTCHLIIFFTGIPFTIYIMITYIAHIFNICSTHVIIIFFTRIPPPIMTTFSTAETNNTFNDPRPPTCTPWCLSQGTTPPTPACPWASSNLVNQHPCFIGWTCAFKNDDENLCIKTNAPHSISTQMAYPLWTYLVTVLASRLLSLPEDVNATRLCKHRSTRSHGCPNKFNLITLIDHQPLGSLTSCTYPA